ncbi:MAG: DUF5317 domain-containing protein [Actinomycetota bacterium]
MNLPLAIVLLAVGAGFIAGGRLRGFESLHLHWWVLAPLGLAMQIVTLPTDGSRTLEAVAAGVLVASYPVLLVFLWVNRRVPGFALIFVGLVLNLAVISPNGGMPVSASAILNAGGNDADIASLERSPDGKHHLSTEEDLLPEFGDTIPLEPLRIVVSAGDLLAYAGLAWAVVGIMLTPAPMPADRTPYRRKARGYRGKHRPGALPQRERRAGDHPDPAPLAAARSGSGP